MKWYTAVVPLGSVMFLYMCISCTQAVSEDVSTREVEQSMSDAINAMITGDFNKQLVYSESDDSSQVEQTYSDLNQLLGQAYSESDDINQLDLNQQLVYSESDDDQQVVYSESDPAFQKVMKDLNQQVAYSESDDDASLEIDQSQTSQDAKLIQEYPEMQMIMKDLNQQLAYSESDDDQQLAYSESDDDSQQLAYIESDDMLNQQLVYSESDDNQQLVYSESDPALQMIMKDLKQQLAYSESDNNQEMAYSESDDLNQELAYSESDDDNDDVESVSLNDGQFESSLDTKLVQEYPELQMIFKGLGQKLAHSESDNKTQQLAYSESDNDNQQLAYLESDDLNRELAYSESNDENQQLAYSELDDLNQELAYAESQDDNQQLPYSESDDLNQELVYLQSDDENQHLAYSESDDNDQELTYAESQDDNQQLVYSESDDLNEELVYLQSDDENQQLAYSELDDLNQELAYAESQDDNQQLVYSESDDLDQELAYSESNDVVDSASFKDDQSQTSLDAKLVQDYPELQMILKDLDQRLAYSESDNENQQLAYSESYDEVDGDSLKDDQSQISSLEELVQEQYAPLQEDTIQEQSLISTQDVNRCARSKNLLSKFKSIGTIDTPDQNTVRLTVNPKTPLGLLQFLPVLRSTTPKQLSDIELKAVSYNCATDKLSAVSRRIERQTIIPGIVDFQRVTITVTGILSNVKSLKILINGVWKVDTIEIEMQATYSYGTQTLDFTATPSKPINLEVLAKKLTGRSLPNPLGKSLILSGVTVSGSVSVGGDATLIVSKLSDNRAMHIVVQKSGDSSNISKAIAVEFKPFKFAKLIQEVTGEDISKIPYFGSVTVPDVAMTISSNDIEDISFPKGPLLNSYVKTIEEGVVGYILFNFLKEPVKVKDDDGHIHLQPKAGVLTVKSLLSAMRINSVSLPKGLINDIKSLYVSDIELHVVDKTAYIEVVYPKAVTPFDGLSITDTTLHITVGKDGKAQPGIDGKVSVSGSGFNATIARDKSSNNYVLSASADTLPISSAIQQFKANVLPPELNSLTKSLPFFSFSIKNPTMSLPLVSPLQLHLGGVPVISGYNTVHMDVVIFKNGPKTLMVEGFEVGRVNLGRLIRTITGVDLRRIAFLNQDLDVAILISPLTLPHVKLTGKRLRDFSVTKGISVQAVMRFPPKCSSDAFCAVAQSLLGRNAQMTLQGTIASSSSFSLFAGVSNIRLGRGVIMSQAGVQIEGGARNSVGLKGVVKLSKPDITFAGRIFLSTSGVVLQLSMSGCWRNAFGANWLDICNLHSSIAMVPGASITGLALGGQVRIGCKSYRYPLIASGYVGIDTVTPTENYYYVNIRRRATVHTVLRAFCINVNLPRPLADSGFPNGFISSFSLVGKELPHARLSIPIGYRLKGKLNILGLVGFADVTIGLPNGIDIAVALPPLNIGNGLIRMYASPHTRSRGPFLKADIDILPRRSVHISASGYLSVLGISRNAKLEITNSGYYFNINGKMLYLYQASLRIYASYGRLTTARFRVQGHFRNDLFSRIEAVIKRTLQNSANAANRAIGRVRHDVENKRRAMNGAINGLRQAQQRVRSAHGAFDSAIRSLHNAENRLKRACPVRRCSTRCIGCPGGLTCCGRVWGRCVCVRPTWNSCCKRITDPICYARNKACQVYRGKVTVALWAARRLVDRSRHTLHIANVALRHAQNVVRGAQHTLNVANHALAGVQHANRLGSQAAGAIARVGVNGLISIREVRFDADLSAAARGSFSGSVTAHFVGVHKTIRLNIKLRDITGTARDLANSIGAGFSNLFG